MKNPEHAKARPAVGIVVAVDVEAIAHPAEAARPLGMTTTVVPIGAQSHISFAVTWL